MFLDAVRSEQIEVKTLQDVVTYFCTPAHEPLRSLLPEFTKFIKILVTIPMTSCTAERSFSALRRFKAFLRSTMTQQRLNDVAICNFHKKLVEKVNFESIADEFIKKTTVRQDTFQVGKYE